MKMCKKIFFLLFFLSCLLLPNFSFARPVSQITDWYIKDFHSDIVVNTDSSLLITEKIVADCGNLSGKHGIFRILPSKINTPEASFSTPVELVSITDFSGKKIPYQEIRNSGTITWKIGDPDRTVQGENEYQIVYKVKNAIRFQENFEELWWNLNGNFWEIETDNYTADIHFPAQVTAKNTVVEHYTGVYGSKNNNLAVWQWNGDVLHVQSAAVLKAGEGISISVTVPHDIFTPYQPTAVENFSAWKFLIILIFGLAIFPLITFIISFLFWKKHGKDPVINKTVIAQYEAPDKLTPIQIGIISGLGFSSQKHISASIIKLACDGVIKIEEIKKKALSFSAKDYKLIVVDQNKANTLIAEEKVLFNEIFNGEAEILLSELKKNFYKSLPEIKKTARIFLIEQGYLENNKLFSTIFSFGLVSYFIIVIVLSFFSNIFWFSFVIIIFFSLLMNKRTLKGAEADWQIKGFKLFINTAEKYRAQFYEKENMFEKILPYAIAFGLAKKWVKAMQDIYGQEKFASMAPVWFISANGMFDIDNFSSALTEMSTAISHSTSASSGAGGGGFSGGGGGGGGGGGW